MASRTRKERADDSMGCLCIGESRGTIKRSAQLSSADGSVGCVDHVRNNATTSAAANSMVALFQRTFLPEGYPQSVTADYAAYQFWDTAQALCSSITGTLSTRAVLRGVGVGSSEADLLSSTLSWVIRDGVGMISRIFFASWIACDLDNDAKRWRLVADLTNDVALTIEVFSSYLPTEWFLVAVCVASVFKAICGVCGGSSKASLTQHFAKKQNTADLSAKEGSQETAAGLVGMLLGMWITSMVPETSFLGTLVVFGAFTLLHLMSNYLAVSSLILSYLNRQRADILLQEFVAQMPLSTPQRLSEVEGIVFRSSKAKPLQITLGASLLDFIGSLQSAGSWERTPHSLQLHAAIRRALLVDNYALVLQQYSGTYTAFFDSQNPAPSTLLASYTHATLHSLQRQRHCGENFVGEETQCYPQTFEDVVVVNDWDNPTHCTVRKVERDTMIQIFSAEALAAGWHLDKVQFRTLGWGVSLEK